MTESASPPRNMRGFLIIWLGELISMLGSGLTGFALGVWIYQETGQATPFAITVLLGSLFGSGPGRGIGIGFVFSGLCLVVACAWAYANPRLRLLEDELPDVI